MQSKHYSYFILPKDLKIILPRPILEKPSELLWIYSVFKIVIIRLQWTKVSADLGLLIHYIWGGAQKSAFISTLTW